MSIPVQVRDLGIIGFKEAWDIQEQLFSDNVQLKFARRKAELENTPPPSGETKNYLLLCEHPHVYTLGKSGDKKNLLVSEDELKRLDAEFFPINRGGDITYHGFGQLVAYPIFDLESYFYTDIHRFLRELEETIIQTIAEFDIHGGRIEGLTGVWINPLITGKERKICAMGIRCSRWITMHGLALNVNTDLSYFSHIVPCGIDDKEVTSMQQETGKQIDFAAVKKVFCEKLAEKFGLLFEG